MGLPQAFLSAGVSQVAMTVWDIGDESTADLMRRFYGNIFRRGKPPSLALREAQIAIWKEPGHSAPWFWAGFIAQGEWKLEVSGSLNKIPPSVSPKQGEPKSLAPTRNPPAPPRR